MHFNLQERYTSAQTRAKFVKQTVCRLTVARNEKWWKIACGVRRLEYALALCSGRFIGEWFEYLISAAAATELYLFLSYFLQEFTRNKLRIDRHRLKWSDRDVARRMYCILFTFCFGFFNVLEK